MTSSQTENARLSAELTSVLHPSAPPIAITFSAELPEGIKAHDAPMQAPGPDGRRGRVAAGCVFWMQSIDRTFTTVAEDHSNCSVGSLTHGLATFDEVAGNDDVAAMLGTGWVTPDMIGAIPKVAEKPGAITYGPLADANDPDVVLVRLTAKSLMVLSDALPGLRIEGKPQCHIIAAAKEQGDVVASVGCIASRTRTGMPSSEMTCAIAAGRLHEVIDAVRTTAGIDSQVASYASTDAVRFA